MPAMDSITLENFRCFRERQTVRLAPLTLLVGENSTGKTSLLALIRSLAALAYTQRPPNFKEPPYDLGSFDEIAHFRGGRGRRAQEFAAGFSVQAAELERRYEFEAAFAKRGTAPTPVRRRIVWGDAWIEDAISPDAEYSVQVGTGRGAWRLKIPSELRSPSELSDTFHLYSALSGIRFAENYPDRRKLIPLEGSPPPGPRDRESIADLEMVILGRPGAPPFAGAPVRSKPHRTYDPARLDRDPEGDYVPMYMAGLMSEDDEKWRQLKASIECFGKAAGLFDEISIRQLGTKAGEPFQVQVRKGGKGLKGPHRNLADVGYGVSQVLPVITELLRPDARAQHLLQQPEVHLHPSAQAALGTLFCRIAAASGKQLIVETHSDHLIDRVRMDVRDGTTGLTPDDVSLLYFERDGLDVKIHELCFDERGNVLGAPPGYRQFFLEEVNRSLGL